MKLDFSETKDTVLLPEGECVLTITGAKEEKSKNGTNMLVLDLKDENEGFTRDNICLEGPGAFKAKNLLKGLGMTEEEFAGINASDLIGMQLTCVIAHEDYEGEPRARVKKYIAA